MLNYSSHHLTKIGWRVYTCAWLPVLQRTVGAEGFMRQRSPVQQSFSPLCLGPQVQSLSILPCCWGKAGYHPAEEGFWALTTSQTGFHRTPVFSHPRAPASLSIPAPSRASRVSIWSFLGFLHRFAFFQIAWNSSWVSKCFSGSKMLLLLSFFFFFPFFPLCICAMTFPSFLMGFQKGNVKSCIYLISHLELVVSPIGFYQAFRYQGYLFCSLNWKDCTYY